MYYQCILLPEGHKVSDNIRKLSPAVQEQLRCRTMDCGAEVLAALDKALAAQDIEFPIVMLGLDVIAMGDHAPLRLLKHMCENPHVHWEASDGEDAI